MLAELGHEVVGIDLPDRMLKIAKEKTRKLGFEGQFKMEDAENLHLNTAHLMQYLQTHSMDVAASAKSSLVLLSKNIVLKLLKTFLICVNLKKY